MRALVQRVAWARVEIGGQVVGEIGPGLLVYLGVAPNDGQPQIAWLSEKLAGLRIFEDEQEKMNLSVQDARGGVLVVTNFTLLADARKGRRPSFDAAAHPDLAEPLSRIFVQTLRDQGCQVQTGKFGADMQVFSQADGPVNVIIDTP